MFNNEQLDYLKDLERERDILHDYMHSEVCSEKQLGHCERRINQIDNYLSMQKIREQRLFNFVYRH